MHIALYEPDIPQNTGTILRLAACLGCHLHIIEPCGFTFTDRQLKRSVMDYAPLAEVSRHDSWEDFLENRPSGGRLILMTTKAAVRYTDYQYQAEDVLLFGNESSGAPEEVHEKADARILIPMVAGARSLNLATAVAMVSGEALRQSGGLP